MLNTIMKFNLATFVKYLKNTNFILAVFFLILFSVFVASKTPDNASASIQQGAIFDLIMDQGFHQELAVHPIGESLSEEGVYSVTYRFSEDSWIQKGNAGVDVTFPVQSMSHKCQEGNGQFFGIFTSHCVEVGVNRDVKYVTLNAANGYVQNVTFNIQQVPAVKCGSFQTDVYAGFELKFVTGSIYHTAVDCPSATPTPTPTATPTPTPTPSVTPTPKPSKTPMPQGHCPMNWVEEIHGSAVVCVAQNQNQGQSQIQNNNQNQDVNQNVFATGGNSSSSSSSSSNTDIKIN